MVHSRQRIILMEKPTTQWTNRGAMMIIDDIIDDIIDEIIDVNDGDGD